MQIEDKDTWISNWNLQPNNQYLNQVSQIFLEAAKEEAASYNIVEVVVRMISSIGMKYGKNSYNQFSALCCRYAVYSAICYCLGIKFLQTH